MQVKLLNIADYAVSPISGFLPPEPPLNALPRGYKTWDDLAKSLPHAISSKTLRSDVASLPVLTTDELGTSEQLHRGFVVLGFLIHGYIWCDGSDHPEPNVPAQLAEPYLQVCQRLGMQPTLSYAGLCLWNWQIKDRHAGAGLSNGAVNGETLTGLKNLDDLNCLISFTGTRDEAVFYLIPVMVEAEGGRLVNLLLQAMKDAMCDENEDSIVQALEQTRDTLPKLASLIKHLHERCDPKVFYEKVRPFYPGAKGMEEKGMPDGVIFNRSDGTKVMAKCVGGSAAQSSLFQFIDLALGVKHRPVGEASGETVFEVSHLLNFV